MIPLFSCVSYYEGQNNENLKEWDTNYFFNLKTPDIMIKPDDKTFVSDMA